VKQNAVAGRDSATGGSNWLILLKNPSIVYS
jgi:hypothetical protein